MGLAGFYYKTNPEDKLSNRAQGPRVWVFFEPFSFIKAIRRGA